MKSLKKVFFIFCLFILNQKVVAQAQFTQSDSLVLNIVTDFGANPNDSLDDTWAFIKASKYLQNRWDSIGNTYSETAILANDHLNINYANKYAVLQIPAANTPTGHYIVGKQQKVFGQILDGYNFGLIKDTAMSLPKFYVKYKTIFGVSLTNSDSLQIYPFSYRVDTLDPFYTHRVFIDTSATPDDTFRTFIHIDTFNLKTFATTDTIKVTYNAPYLYEHKQANFYAPHVIGIPNFEIDNKLIPTNKVIGIKIIGIASSVQSQPIIKYKDSLGMGFVDNFGNNFPVQAFDTLYTAGDGNMTINHLFQFKEVNNIEISNLNVNGNSPMTFIHGAWLGWEGYQSGHAAMDFYNSRNITLQNNSLNYMGLDGIHICDTNPNTLTNVWMNHINCFYNKRQGISWVGGRNVTLLNSKLNFTGRAISIVQPGLSLHSAPASGIDVEPENHIIYIPYLDSNGTTKYNSKKVSNVCRNGYLKNVEMLNNHGCALENNVQKDSLDYKSYASNIIVDSCILFSKSHTTIWANGDSNQFRNCKIYGNVIKLARGTIPNSGTKFYNCHFEDKVVNGEKLDSTFGHLISVDFSGNYSFDSCTFVLNDTNREVFDAFNLQPSDSFKKYNILKDCTVYYNNFSVVDTLNVIQAKLSKFIFKGVNKFIDTLQLPFSAHGFRTTDCIIQGSNDPCKPDTILLHGNVYHIVDGAGAVDSLEIGNIINNQTNSKDSAGFCNYIVENIGLLYLHQLDHKINIGKNSKLIIQNKGNLYAQGQSGKINIKGQLLFKDSAYLCNKDGQFIRANPLTNSMLLIDTTVQIALSPIWAMRNYICNYVPTNTSSPLSLSNAVTATPIAGSNALINSSWFYNPQVSNAYFEKVDNFCCNDSFNASANKTYILGETASNLQVMNSTGATASGGITNGNITQGATTYTGYTFFVKDSFIINQNTTFNHTNFYFTANTKIVLQNNAILTLNNCILKAGCGLMWQGIFADEATEQILINNCTITDMQNGVSLGNNAKLTSTNSTYSDNTIGIYIFNNLLPNNITIEKNIFNKHNGLLQFADSINTPLHGILINKSTNIDIGGVNSFAGNSFDSLANAICITAKYSGSNLPFWQSFTPYTGDINLKYCHIYNIYNTNISSLNTDPSKGVAIYANNYGYGAWLTNQVRINIIGNGNTLCSTPNFTNCHKAIVNNNFSSTVRFNRMSNVRAGVLLQNCRGKNYLISDNIINNCIIGISKVGNEDLQGFTAMGNIISLDKTTNPSLVNTNVCTGISSIYNTQTSGVSSKIVYNIINIPNNDSARGINLENGNLDLIANNIIHFVNTENAGAPINVPWLIGINSNFNKGTTISKNVIDNNFMVDGTTITTPNNSTGIYLHKTDNPIVSCNLTNYLQFGITGVGDNGNSTQYNLFTRNIMNASHASLMLFKLGNEGTVGQVGKIISLTPFNTYDANNTYIGAAALAKVYRVTDTTCTQAINGEIVTTVSKLVQTQSNSNTTNCFYSVTNPTSFTQTAACPGDPYTNNDWQGNAQLAQTDINKAINVALQAIEYTEFEYGAKKLDEEQTYAFLEQNPTIRTNNPILNAFYLSHYTTDLGLMDQANEAIQLLSDSTIINDELLWQTSLHEAKLANALLVNPAPFINNTYFINHINLHSLEYGLDSINNLQWQQIETLANACPYIAGDAVYKAREIISYKNPSMNYNDLQICNAQGYYRTTQQNSLAQRLKQVNADYNSNSKIQNSNLIVYPNPATNTININYEFSNSETATLSIYNLLGILVKQININSNKELLNINIANLQSGLYTYKFIPLSNNISCGKLVIK